MWTIDDVAAWGMEIKYTMRAITAQLADVGGSTNGSAQ
jgi:hypothetical protein